MPAKIRLSSAAAAVSVLLSACAASTETAPAQLSTAAAPLPGYKLSDEELALDCKKLTGRMQVRILQIRGYQPGAKSTFVSRGLQAATTSVLGGTLEGTDPDSRYGKDRAMLEAYNTQLAAKGCATFNLEAELQPQPIGATPTPVAKAKAVEPAKAN